MLASQGRGHVTWVTGMMGVIRREGVAAGRGLRAGWRPGVADPSQ